MLTTKAGIIKRNCCSYPLNSRPVLFSILKITPIISKNFMTKDIDFSGILVVAFTFAIGLLA
jgi:hypothetical protein